MDWPMAFLIAFGGWYVGAMSGIALYWALS